MKKIKYIDINCDVGEGVGNEEALLPLIGSCSIACGGHAGDMVSMREIVRLAKGHNVAIGAHPSYPDKENFGRLSMNIPVDELTSSIQKQVSDLMMILEQEKTGLGHIKPHGALYNDLAKDEALASIFLIAIQAYKDSVTLFVPYKSQLEKSALSQGFKVKREAFADRNYNSDLSLVSRKRPNALLTKPAAVLRHLLLMANEQKVRTIDNLEIELKAETFCLHGDTPDALGILMYIREYLNDPRANISIAK